MLASAVGMDKVAMKDLFRAHGLPSSSTPRCGARLERDAAGRSRAASAREIGFPCFVKPANLGSSVGISKVKAPEELAAAIELAARHDRRIIVERGDPGPRGGGGGARQRRSRQASVPGEVTFPGEWYDYETKYGAGQTTLKIPAPLSPDVDRGRCGRSPSGPSGPSTARAWRGSTSLSRATRRVLVNEINTIPGFTSTSAYPRLWEASGIPYPELIA